MSATRSRRTVLENDDCSGREALATERAASSTAGAGWPIRQVNLPQARWSRWAGRLWAPPCRDFQTRGLDGLCDVRVARDHREFDVWTVKGGPEPPPMPRIRQIRLLARACPNPCGYLATGEADDAVEPKREPSGSRTVQSCGSGHYLTLWAAVLVAYAVAIKLGIDIEGVQQGGILFGAWVAAEMASHFALR